ncbi:MAG: NAD(P)/FAD-dependent oxidoreductase [Chloroflexota bacterium]|nr:NAD(P)/FAD-dependent oxidoreductase [Chloroflexota bacterium]MDE2941277.1 NAD(P)/FAD-dependent oxidoreductase [Chloroflexota bacterium]MDE3267789.1 NAD(P)/FAD-dependent oxidoreductase [Chloroflexota bacterium]
MSTPRVVIVGGGFAGLSAAYTLTKLGITPLLLEAQERVGGRGKGEKVDGFSLDMGAFVFTSTYDTAFRICKELGLPLVPSTMKFGHRRNGRWVTTTPDQSLWNFVRHLRTAFAMGFLSPPGMWAGFRVMRQIHRQSAYMSFAGDSPLAEIDDDESFGDYLKRLRVPEKLQVTLRGPLDMVLGDPLPAGQALMRAYIGETMLSGGKVYMPERGIGSLAEALANACADAIRVSTPVRKVVVADGSATGVVADGETIETDAVICAVPGTKVPELIPELPPETRRALSTVSYSTGCRVVIGLDHRPLPAGWHGALYPEDDDTPLLLDRSTFLPACAPPGRSILDLLVGRDRAKELIPLDDEEIKRQLLGAARRKAPPGSALPGDHEGLYFRVYRWEEALCMGTPGMLAAAAKIPGQLAERIDNLVLAGDYMRVPSVNGALSSGHSAAIEVANLLASRSN